MEATERSTRLLTTLPAYAANDKTGWGTRHLSAIVNPKGVEVPLVKMLAAWLEYADMHRAQYGDVVGNDYVLGGYWATMGRAIHHLLDGDTGRLDCGTLSGKIIQAMTENGVAFEG